MSTSGNTGSVRVTADVSPRREPVIVTSRTVSSSVASGVTVTSTTFPGYSSVGSTSTAAPVAVAWISIAPSWTRWSGAFTRKMERWPGIAVRTAVGSSGGCTSSSNGGGFGVTHTQPGSVMRTARSRTRRCRVRTPRRRTAGRPMASWWRRSGDADRLLLPHQTESLRDAVTVSGIGPPEVLDLPQLDVRSHAAHVVDDVVDETLALRRRQEPEEVPRLRVVVVPRTVVPPVGEPLELVRVRGLLEVRVLDRPAEAVRPVVHGGPAVVAVPHRAVALVVAHGRGVRPVHR